MSIQPERTESRQVNASCVSERYIRGARPWLAMSVLLTGNFVTILDLFIVNVAIGSIQRDLHASSAEVALFLVGYSAPYGIMLLNGARLGDLYGRRRIFLTGMALFSLASLLCGLAPTPEWLITARALQGLGAALLMPQVFASLRVLFEGNARRRAFAVMGAVQGVAASVSQLAGGFLIEHSVAGAGWRWVFLINLPVGLVALIAGRLLIIETRAAVPARLDLRGAMLSAFALGLLLIPFMEGQEYGWPWWSIALPLLSIPVFGYFYLHERALSARGGAPVIDVCLFRNHRFVAGVLAIFLFYSSISSFFLSLTLLLQPGLGLSPLAAGTIFTPSAIAFFAASLTGPKLANIMGHKALLSGVAMFWGAMVLAIGIGIASPDNVPLLIISLILNGLGQGLVIPLALNAILSCLHVDHAGVGSGIVSTMQILGTAIGVAIVGVVFFSSIHHNEALHDATHAVSFGHALALATVYNVVAVTISFIGFMWLSKE